MKKILIVEDRPTQAILLKHLMKAGGFVAEIVPDGSKALEKIGEGEWGLLITDINLPEMDGHALTKKLHSEDATKDLPVFLMTAGAAGESDAGACTCGCGALRILQKPLKKDIHLPLIEEALGSS